ncbi:MAG: class I SAM-dependent methyltransferase [Nitrospira sp.]|nr:class I SAM-dependent methyltransferase [Nitrospira sp.]MCP9442091.1 class I SAM-dependent methyltransferase [Nitrospira sp.]
MYEPGGYGGGAPSSIPCNLCGGTEVSTLSNRSRSGKPLRTVICRACGLVWSDPRPHDARRFYEEEYRISYKQTYQPKSKHVLRAGKVALSRFEKIKEFLLAGPKRILDVGSGGGEFAYLLQSLGHHIHGVEPNRGYAEYSQRQYGLTVRIGFVQDMVFPAESFDLITMWHVLEHTEDPGAVLARLRSWLKPGGTLVVEVPNVEATCQAPQNTFHEAHLYNFNVVTLRRLAKKQGLYEIRHVISRDGGNITMALARDESPAEADVKLDIPGNYEWIARIVRGHRAWRHHLSLMPYLRAWQRGRRSLEEWRETTSGLSGKALLDDLYRRELQTCCSIESDHGVA